MREITVTGTIYPSLGHTDSGHEMGLSNSGYEHYFTRFSYLGLEPEFTAVPDEPGKVTFTTSYDADEDDRDPEDNTGLTTEAYERLLDSMINAGAQDIEVEAL